MNDEPVAIVVDGEIDNRLRGATVHPVDDPNTEHCAVFSTDMKTQMVDWDTVSQTEIGELLRPMRTMSDSRLRDVLGL